MWVSGACLSVSCPAADEGCCIEFPRTADADDGPFPLCWFRFNNVGDDVTPLPQGELRCELRQPRALRYLLIRLIAPEDRMEVRAAWHWMALGGVGGGRERMDTRRRATAGWLDDSLFPSTNASLASILAGRLFR